MRLSHLIASAAIALSAPAMALNYTVTLSGAAESPVNASPGTGTGTVQIDEVLRTMTLHVSFSGLIGTVTNSHIHCCTAAAGASTAGVATVTPTFTGFPGGVTSGTYDRVFDMTLSSSWNAAFVTAHGGTTAQAFTDLVAGINAGKAYWNIHSTQFAGGEIRGFLAPVPEPETYALMLAGLGLLGWTARRRQRG